MKGTSLTARFAIVLAAVCGVSAASAHASLIVSYQTSARSVSANSSTDAATPNSFGVFAGSASFHETGENPFGAGPYESRSSASQYSFFQPFFVHAVGDVSTYAFNTYEPDAYNDFAFTFSINEPTTFYLHFTSIYGNAGLALDGPGGHISTNGYWSGSEPIWYAAPAGTYSLSIHDHVPSMVTGTSNYTLNMFIPSPPAIVPALLLGAISVRRRR